MELALLVYLANVVPNLHGLFFTIAMLSVLTTVVSIVVIGVHSDESYHSDRSLENNRKIRETLRNVAKRAGIATVVTAFLCVLTPSNEKTMYMIAGAWGLQTVATSDTAKKVYELVEIELNDALEKAKAEREKGKAK